MPPKKGKSKELAATKVVSDSRFKTLKVNERISIRNFVEKHKLKFAAGKGFYQLTKPETIQFHKEIVVRRKSDGTMACGDEVTTNQASFMTYCLILDVFRSFVHLSFGICVHDGSCPVEQNILIFIVDVCKNSGTEVTNSC